MDHGITKKNEKKAMKENIFVFFHSFFFSCGYDCLGYILIKGSRRSKHSNEAALPLRSRRNGTKFANPASPRVRSLSADVFQGASFGIVYSCASYLPIL